MNVDFPQWMCRMKFLRLPLKHPHRRKFRPSIIYREGVVAEKQIIADALLHFGSVVKSLPEADQKELVQIIIKEVSVKHFDPENNPPPQGKRCA